MKSLSFKRKFSFGLLLVIFLSLFSITVNEFSNSSFTKNNLSSQSFTSNEPQFKEGEEYFTITSNEYDRIDINWDLTDHQSIDKITNSSVLAIQIKEIPKEGKGSVNEPQTFVHQIDDIEEHLVGHDYFDGLKQDTTFEVHFSLIIVLNDPSEFYEYSQNINTIAGFNFAISLENLTADSARIRWDYQIFDNRIVLNFIKLSGTGMDDNNISVANSNSFDQDSFLINDLEPLTEYDDWTIVINYDDNKEFVYYIDTFETSKISSPELFVGDIETLSTNYGVRISYYLISNGSNITSMILNKGGANYQAIDFKLNQESFFKVMGLHNGQTYEDWTISVYYAENSITVDIPTFTVGDDLIIINPPVIKIANVELTSNNAVKIEWDIQDVDGSVTDIKVEGTDINISLGTALSGTKVIEDLKYSTVYDDWKLIVKFKDNINKQVEKDFNSFTTIEDPNNPDDSKMELWLILLILAISVILIAAIVFGVILYFLKNNQKKINS